jgi:hypothetical protein
VQPTAGRQQPASATNKSVAVLGGVNEDIAIRYYDSQANPTRNIATRRFKKSSP